MQHLMGRRADILKNFIMCMEAFQPLFKRDKKKKQHVSLKARKRFPAKELLTEHV